MAVGKSAIIPYRVNIEGGLEILLVTRSSGRGWTIPKGNVEPQLKPRVSATKEAFEEAGVLGLPHPICVGTYEDNSDSGPIPTFLLEVEVELDERAWQEEGKRHRKWIDADDCEVYITETDMLTVVKRGIRALRSNGEYFKLAIATYCEEHKWVLGLINEERAEMEFAMASGELKLLNIKRYDSTLEFSMPSFAVFGSEKEIPGAFSTALLQRNSETKIGFWCIDKVGDKFIYTCMNNVELKLLDSAHFAVIIKGLIDECDDIEETLAELLKR